MFLPTSTNKTSIFLLAFLTTCSVVSGTCVFKSLLDGGVLTAHAIEQGQSGPGHAYVEAPVIDENGNHSLNQQWERHGMGHGDMYYIALQNPDNEIWSDENRRLVWNEDYSSEFEAYQMVNSYLGRCLENTGLGQRVNTLALCSFPETPQSVWKLICSY